MEITSVGPFILGRTLGTGATGKVKLGFHKNNGFKVAVKIISKNMLKSQPSTQKKLEREISIMRFLDHPNVLKLFDVYDTPNYLFLVLEHVEGGELFDYLLNKGQLEPNEALKFFRQIIHALDYCHSHMICHRDLKPENILLDANTNIKICDYGMAALMRKDALLSTSCGSPHYASPEVIMGGKYNGMESDVWSCGVILFALLVGKLPFDDRNMRKLLLKVKVGVFEMPGWLSKTAKDLIWCMLTVDPSKRITIKQIMQHPWFLLNGAPAMESVELDETAATPLASEDEVIPEVLKTLRTLWGEGENIMAELLSPRQNMTQVFYRLIEERLAKVPEEDSVTAIYEKATSTPTKEALEEQSPRSGSSSKFSFRNRRNSSPNARRNLRDSINLAASPEEEPTSRHLRSSHRTSTPLLKAGGESPSGRAISGSSPKRSWFSFFGKGGHGKDKERNSMRKSTGGDTDPASPVRTLSARRSGAWTPTKKNSREKEKKPKSRSRPSSPGGNSPEDLVHDRKIMATSLPAGMLLGSAPRNTAPIVSPKSPGGETIHASHTYLCHVPPQTVDACADSVLEKMGVQKRYSKTEHCLKAIWTDGVADHTVRFFCRFSHDLSDTGVHNTCVHFELRSGNVTLFDGLFSSFESMMKDLE